jgi:hypothetical protein
MAWPSRQDEGSRVVIRREIGWMVRSAFLTPSGSSSSTEIKCIEGKRKKEKMW